MELKTVEIIVYVLIPILTAVLGGWVGAYFGNKYREDKESHEKEIVRNIAIKALNILKSYAGKSFREAEGEFNKSMSIAEKTDTSGGCWIHGNTDRRNYGERIAQELRIY